MALWKRILGRLILHPPASSEAEQPEPVARPLSVAELTDRLAALPTVRADDIARLPGLTDAAGMVAAPIGDGFPTTYRAAANDGVLRKQIFDPALKQFGRAFRPGDPEFLDAESTRRRSELRRRVTDHVLRRVAESAAGEHLILRGSRLLRAWFRDAAREPGDLDYVIDPPAVGLTDIQATRLFEDILTAVFAPPLPAGVELRPDAVAIDDIWTYERAPGRRIVFPWRAAGLPGGAVQVDVVFGENLAGPARRILVPAADGGCVSVRAAGPAQSLAWKLLWLSTDSYPQGKDLYDAVLLAERFALPRSVMERTFEQVGSNWALSATPADILAWPIDWINFQVEYAWVDGDTNGWKSRLVRALAPTFDATSAANTTPAARPVVTLDPSWRSSTVAALVRGIDADRAFDRLPILADALEEAGCDDADLLTHLRAEGPHAHGCWVVEALRGRE
jgi:hypothetical protein